MRASRPTHRVGRGRRARILWRTLVVLGGLAVGGEGLLRAFPQLCPIQQQLKIASSEGSHAWVDDPDLGARPAPRARDTVRTLDYEYALRLDSLGFPNPMPWPEHPDIVILGNSLAVGPGVGIDGQFSTLLDRALEGQGVLNLALPGGSPLQQLRIFDRYARALRPRAVVATLWVASDVDNAAQFEHWLAEGSPPDFTAYRESFGTTHGGHEVLETVRDLLSGSYLLRAAYYAASGLAGRRGPEERVDFGDGESIYLWLRGQRRLAEGATRPGVDLARDVIDPLVRLRAAAGEDGARFVVVLLPSKEEIYGADAYPAVLRTVTDVRRALAAADLPVLDLYGLFRTRGRERPPFYTRDIHFNAFGNALVAEALEDWMANGT